MDRTIASFPLNDALPRLGSPAMDTSATSPILSEPPLFSGIGESFRADSVSARAI
jgi:hypothetical protein